MFNQGKQAAGNFKSRKEIDTKSNSNGGTKTRGICKIKLTKN